MATHEFSADADPAGPSPDDVIARLCAAIDGGEPWFGALLAAIAAWRLPEESVSGRRYRYLVGGEAFDWLLLAERLLDAVGERVPRHERDQLLYHGRPPADLSPEEFRRRIGASKYRAYLNFHYGVTVEEALQLTVEEDVEKERRSHVSRGASPADELAFERIYGSSRSNLLMAFRDERGHHGGDTISLEELKEFTYWLFKYRLLTCAPPKVASDTTRGLSRLASLEALRRPAPSTFVSSSDVLDLRPMRT